MSENKNTVAPFAAREIQKRMWLDVDTHLNFFLKKSIVASLYIFDAFVSFVLQYIMDLNILFISDKLSLTLWNLKIEISKGLNKIEIKEKEALFIYGYDLLLIYKVSNLELRAHKTLYFSEIVFQLC